ncbi:MAG TPA: amidohydrolase [Bosea sp. (in: a-proteobacteria)]|nr:amidohydrolase [Bosea sp. (in: a-proteobacteria)]
MLILEQILPFLDELKAIRQDIHQHPELGLEEVRTAALVAAKLREWNVEVVEGIGGTGVVGVLKGDRPGQRMIGLRADMDALPIAEKTGLPYASRHPGIMHACGHDGHTAMLLGAARHLSANRDFGGTVVLIFQPAEEGRGGARGMVRDGLFSRFPCDAIYALHNRPGMPIGDFAVRPGVVTANCDRWRVTFHGTGGHGGSTPHLATDVTVVGGHFLLAAQTIVSRNVAARETAVLSVGFVEAGAAESPNIMPSELTIRGVTRTFDIAVRETIRTRLEALAQSLAEAHACKAEVEYWQTGYAVTNSPESAAVARAAAVAIVGEGQVAGDLPPSTGGEDFAEMLHVVPGCMASIGNGADGTTLAPRLHTPLFDFNDEALPYGIAYWAGVIEQELGSRA